MTGNISIILNEKLKQNIPHSMPSLTHTNPGLETLYCDWEIEGEFGWV